MGVNRAAFADFFCGCEWGDSVDSNSSEASSIPEEDDDDESILLLTFTVNWGEAVKLEIVDSVLIDPFDLLVGLIPPVLLFLAGSSGFPSSLGRFFLLGLLPVPPPPPLPLPPPWDAFLLLPVFWTNPDVAAIQLGREVGAVRFPVH